MNASALSRINAPAALAAFLRGVERRGAVLAELQCGDAGAGDAALAATMDGFRAVVADQPMADWPRAFWARLLAQPQLRQRVPVAIVLDATDALSVLGSGPRGALLLRLAAGLDEAEAAVVLGVAQPTYRLALRRALPSHADGRADPDAWRRLREQVQHRIKALPQDRLLRLAGARDAALRRPTTVAPPYSQSPASGQAAAIPRRGRLLAALWTSLALCAIAFAATFWWGDALDDRSAEPGNPQVRQRPLPPAQAPASGYGREAGLIAHRDFALLTDPLLEANTRDLEFYSWLAAQSAVGAGATGELPALARASPTWLGEQANAGVVDAAANTETGDAPR